MPAHVVATLVAALIALLSGCSSDTSLGTGLPSGFAYGDAASLRDAYASRCGNHVAVDAGGGLGDGLLAWYRCEAPAASSSAVLLDATAHHRDGALATATGSTPGFSFAPGKVGDALDLSHARQGYARLPEGLLADACEATVATWVYINSSNNDLNTWARVWDFGQDTTAYMFLTPLTNVDSTPLSRFAISVSGNSSEEVIKAEPVPTMKWTHVAVVLGPSGGVLYFDGVAVGTNPTMTLRPADLGATANDWIGRSEFTKDPFFDGAVDEFRIYDRALSPEEIQALVTVS